MQRRWRKDKCRQHLAGAGDVEKGLAFLAGAEAVDEIIDGARLIAGGLEDAESRIMAPSYRSVAR
jgi:hypothetical protein